MKNRISASILAVIILLLTGAFVACSDDGGTQSAGGGSSSGDSQIVGSELSVANEDMNIYGKVYVPESLTENQKMPAVILSHSAGLTSDSMQSYCAGFAARGYVAYAFDFCGGSSDSRSDGNEEDMTVFTEVDDLKAVIDNISALDYVDENRIYLFGTSQGGLVTALTAEEYSAKVKGMILLYPAFNIPEIIKQFADYDFDSSSLGSFGSGSLGGTGSLGFPMPNNGEAFKQTLIDFDVYENIGTFGGNVLILHGSNDFIVSSSYSQRAAELYANCDLYIIEGASHGFNSENYSFSGDYDAEVWQYIEEYLASEH